MELQPLGQSVWDDLNQNLLYLALLHLSVVAFVGSILLARAAVPSLVYTGHVPERAGRLRLVFYALAALSGLAVIIVAFLWISSLDVLYDYYGHTHF